MTGGILLPSEHEISKYLLDTLRHVFHVEYFISHLRMGNSPIQRPHDIVGEGNKFEWNVIKGLSLQYHTPRVDFATYILPALNLHRLQHHHLMWNESNTTAKPVDMFLGAIDATCSLLENRAYQGGSHSYEDVKKIFDNNPDHKIPWTKIIVPRMAAQPQPDLERITSINSFPNIGVPELIYEKIVFRAAETISMLQQRGYALQQ